MPELSSLFEGFRVAFQVSNVAYAFIGALLGTAVGVLPGLGPPTVIALLLPLSYRIQDPVGSIIMMAGIFYGAVYGGSTTSILLRIPGEAASVVTAIDGHELARQGKAGLALAVAAIGSFVAGTVSVVAMTLLAPPLASVALGFGPPEYFALALLGLSLTAYLSSGSPTKGFIMAALGLLLSTVGLDPVSAVPRLTFGNLNLMTGIDFTVLTMGLFGVAEVLLILDQGSGEAIATKLQGVMASLRELAKSTWSIARGTVTGFLVGVLPGGSATLASLVSYAVEKRTSRHPERFGRGAVEGVAGPESANNAAATSSFIPLMTLGIPGNPSIAMIYAALLINGVTPGPFLVQEHPTLFWGVIASMYLGNLMLLVLNLPLVGVWAQITRVPYTYLGAGIGIVTLIGAYSVNNSIYDIWIMLAAGVLGYIARRHGFEQGPLLLAFVLGPILEQSLRQSLLLSHGSPLVFLQRPISGTLVVITIGILFAGKLYRALVRGRSVKVARPS